MTDPTNQNQAAGDAEKPSFRFTKDPGSAMLYYGDEFVAKFGAAHRKVLQSVLDSAAALAEIESEVKRLQDGWKSSSQENCRLEKELGKRSDPMPSCAHCRGEIGVVLTTVADKGIAERNAAEVERLKEECVRLESRLRLSEDNAVVGQAENAALKEQVERLEKERSQAVSNTGIPDDEQDCTAM